MDARTAESHFKEADSLYRNGRYAEALDRLIELDEAFPNTPNIMFPLARCLRRVGRVDEALAICDDLITRRGDMRALELREFIRKSHPPEEEESLQPQVHSIAGLNQDAHAGVLDDLLGDTGPLPPPVPRMGEAAPSNKKYWVIGGGVLLVVALIALPLMVGLIRGPSSPAPPPAQAQTSPSAESAPSSVAAEAPEPLTQEEIDAQRVREFGKDFFGRLALTLTLNVVCLTFSLYMTLKIANKLPYDAIVDDLIHTGGMAVILMLVSLLPCLGLIIAIVILHKVYEFGFIEFLLFIGLTIGAGVVLGILYAIVLLTTGQLPAQ